MRFVKYDNIKLDQMHIIEDSKCCLKVNAVISKAGVYQYDDGMALKPKMELLKATRTARYAKLTLHNHPTSKIIMSQKDLYGGVEKPRFERDKIRAVLNFDKEFVPRHLIDKIREAALGKAGLDVSIGFYYNHDVTPGIATNVNNGQKQHYDYVMRDIMIDHVAVMFDGHVHGRCTFPSCGIGVDTILQWIDVKTDKVVKRGEKWCVVHCHPDGSIGKVIKCFATKQQAEAMHRAIQAQKHGAMNNMTEPYEMYFAKVDQDKRPPKEWWDNCTSKAQSFASDPNRFCNWVWYEADPSMRASFGGASESTIGGVKKTMSLEEMYYPERSKEFNECVTQRIADGMTRGEAEAHCAAATKPEDEPAPPPGETGTAQEETPWQKCIATKTGQGLSMEEAAAKCKEEGVTQTPAAEQDQEVEKTPLERCIAEQVDAGKSEEEAREYCEAELAGEHEKADSLITRNIQLLKLKTQRDIERRRDQRRKPLGHI